MPFRASFDCLWCGTHHEPRTESDIEGWAQLCPTCVGRAGENGFLRFRLRAALDERGRVRAGLGTATAAVADAPRAGSPGGQSPPGSAASPALPASPPLPASHAPPASPARRGPAVMAPTDDWYLRRGRHSLGAIGDATWASDLDAATLWVDAAPLHGRIVEVDAGDGWWSPLLAVKGELWAHAASDGRLEKVRARLVAHGLRAHVHVGEPDLGAGVGSDGVFVAFRLGRLDGPARAALLQAIRTALRPGGALVTVDLLAGGRGSERGPQGTPDIPRDGGEPIGPDDGIDPAALDAALREAGFLDVEIERTSRFFVVARART